MGLSYHALKMLHLFGVVVFLGNIIVTAWWKIMADRTRDPRIIAFAQRQVSLTDLVFTAGGVAIVLLTGFGMIGRLGMGALGEPWLRWGLGLFAASGTIWVAILLPLQVAQGRMARAFASGGEIPEHYWRYGRLWAAFGILATVLPLLNLYWMVFKR